MSTTSSKVLPVHNPVFPTGDSLEGVIKEARHELTSGQMTPNRLRVLFGIYHNTLLKKAESKD